MNNITDIKEEKKYALVTRLLIVFVVVSLLLTLLSMAYFRLQIVRGDIENTLNVNEYARNYAFITRDNADAMWESVYREMKMEGELTNTYVERLGSNLAVNYSKKELMEIAINSGYDGIIYEADDSQGSVRLINKAIAKGIPVVTLRSDSPSSKRKSFVGVSYYNLGVEYSRLILNAIKENSLSASGDEKVIKVAVLIDASLQDTSQNVTVNAIKDGLEAKPKSISEIEVEALEIDNSNDFSAEESIRNVVFNDETIPDIIVCLNEINTVSVVQTMVEKNMVGNSIVLGYYDSDSIINAIDKNLVYATIAIDADQMGRDCVDALNEFIEYQRVSAYYGVDYIVIDKNNVSGYLIGGKEDE